MKPAFALNLAHDRITLLHRDGGNWVWVGDVGLDDPDLERSLRALRKGALALAPDGITCKVIVPASQILYTTLAAPGPDARSRKSQIRAALAGMTPYAVDELVYDWSGTGASVQVAVVARETLDEAETFAAEHRFGPVSFVAIPEPAQFAGEPFFGITQVASKILPDDDRVMRDNDPVRLPPPVVMGPANAAPDPAPVDATDTGDQSPDIRVEAPGDATQPALPEATDPGAAETPANAGRLTLIATDDAADGQADAVPPPETVPRRGKKRGRRKDQRPADPLLAEAPARNTDGELAEATPTDNSKDPARTADVAFASRRAHGAVTPPETEIADTTAEIAQPSPQEATPPRLPGNVNSGVIEAAAAAPTAAAVPRVRPLDLAQHPVGMTAPTAPDDPDEEDQPAASRPTTPPPAMISVTGPERTARVAARRLTGKVGERPVAMALLAAVVIVVVVIFAWAAVFRGGDQISTENRAVDAGPQAITAVGTARSGEQASADLAPLIKAPSASGVPALAAAPAPVVPPSDPATDALQRPGPFADQRPAGATGDATGALAADALPVAPMGALVAPLSPVQFVAQPLQTRLRAFTPGVLPSPPAQSAETILVSAPDRGLDPGLLIDSAIRLIPGPADNADRPPSAQTPPPRALDDLAPREGIAANPPPAKGAEVAALTPAVVPEGTVAATPPQSTKAANKGRAVANPALAGFRPRARPKSVGVAAAAAEKAAEKAAAKTIAAETNEAIVAALRPRARPKAMAADLAAEAAARAAAASSAASAAAIASSLRPDSRPRTFAAVAPVQPPASAPEQSGPEDDGEPDIKSAAPRIPTRASVAAQATMENAMALRDVNLIGVYGDSSNRRAIVRMPNGKMVRVRVGDKIDGGQVAAIDKARLIYVKGGRSHVLDMPKG